jgi:uncharacterized protein YecE (DUF72 family)
VGIIRVGTASWTDKTLLASGWYPDDVKSAEERLQFYASAFPIVEVDSTYYTPPNERNSELWAQRTPPGFTFNVKAYSLLTQHPTRVASIYKDLRPESAKANIYAKDLDPKVVEQVWDRFLSALDPLHQAGKLGALLFQFPQWFPISRANKNYILECKHRAAPVPICVEFRNRTWMSDDNAAETLDFLRTYAVPYVCVDMPQGHTSSIPPVVAATADLAVVRFHGHSDKWTSKDIYDRFGYHYSHQELTDWAPKVAALAASATETQVFMNNCYSDYAQTNAADLMDLLRAIDADVDHPET